MPELTLLFDKEAMLTLSVLHVPGGTPTFSNLGGKKRNHGSLLHADQSCI